MGTGIVSGVDDRERPYLLPCFKLSHEYAARHYYRKGIARDSQELETKNGDGKQVMSRIDVEIEIR